VKRVLLIAGTRPEAIKLAPLVRELRNRSAELQPLLCSTGQQPDLLPPVWESFRLQPDFHLSVMCPGQPLAALSARLLEGLHPVIRDSRPDAVVVQGDTASALCGAQAAFYGRVPLVHVEAGLRTYDRYAPFPEEMNRVLIARLADLHCAPTEQAAHNLRSEGIAPEAIHITGNTGTDALLWTLDQLTAGNLSPACNMPTKRLPRVVATMHRRESFANGLASVCEALNALATDGDIELIVPLHPNPEAQSQVRAGLRPHPNLTMTPPLDYVSFVALMRSADVILTDSGGIQEEAPYLGVPVVVLRERTERQEGVSAGVATLVGFVSQNIVNACRKLLSASPGDETSGGHHTIYGDGTASARIARLIHSFLSA